MLFPHLQNDDRRYLDQVQLTGMLLSCVIGIYPNERHRKQPVTIDLCLYLNTRRAAKTTSIHDTIDYATAVRETSFILEQCEFLLIETAVEAVCQYFLATYTNTHRLPQVDAVMVRISKPSALAHGIVPAVQILRERDLNPTPTSSRMVIHESALGRLTLALIDASNHIHVSTQPQHAKAALTLGKWMVNGAPVKQTSTVDCGEALQTLHHEQAHPQLILLYDI